MPNTTRAYRLGYGLARLLGKLGFPGLWLIRLVHRLPTPPQSLDSGLHGKLAVEGYDDEPCDHPAWTIDDQHDKRCTECYDVLS